MKRLAFAILILVGGCSPKTVTRLTLQSNRLLYTSSDINQVSLVDSISRIRAGGLFLGKNVKFTLRNGEHRTVPKSEIWGYSDEKGRVWRCFRKSFYQVLRVNNVVEYEVVESRNVGHNIVVNEPVRMYSKTLDSKIVGSRKRALRLNDESKAE